VRVRIRAPPIIQSKDVVVENMLWCVDLDLPRREVMVKMTEPTMVQIAAKNIKSILCC